MKAFLPILGFGVSLSSAFSYEDLPNNLPNHEHRPQAPGWPEGNWHHGRPLWYIGTCHIPKKEKSKKHDKRGLCVAYDTKHDKTKTYQCGIDNEKTVGVCKKDGDPCYVNAFPMLLYKAFCKEEGYGKAAGSKKQIDGRDAAPEEVDDRIEGFDERSDEDDFDQADGDHDLLLEDGGGMRRVNATLVKRGREHGKRARCSLKLKEDPVPGKCKGAFRWTFDDR